MTNASAIDDILSLAQPELLLRSHETWQRGSGWALLVTVDCDSKPLVNLWPVTRIARMLGANDALAEAIVRRHEDERSTLSLLVVVCVPGERPTVIVMRVEKQTPRFGWYSVGYVRIDRHWHYVWAVWPDVVPSEMTWITPLATGSVQQSFDSYSDGSAFERAEIAADEKLREVLGEHASTNRLDKSFAVAAWREAQGGRPNYRRPRAGVTKYAPMQGHDRPPSQPAVEYHNDRQEKIAAKNEDLERTLARLRHGVETRSPIERMIDEAVKR